MKILSIITGVITLISFGIQMWGIFPAYKDSIEKISFVLLGIMVGLIIAFFDKKNVEISKPDSSQLFSYVFFGIIALGFLTIIGSLVLTDNKEKISTLQTMLFWLGAFTLLALQLLSGFLLRANETTLDEKIALARMYLDKKNFGKAIYFYRIAFKSLAEDDTRREALTVKIEEVKAEQISGTGNHLV